MAAIPSPVTPAVVRWVVEEDGRRPADLADALKVDEDTLLAWLEGEAKPSKGQVTKLAEVLRRPRALFFLPAPPEGAALPIGFRHPPGAPRDVSQAARLQLRRARRVQDAVAWTMRDLPPLDLPQHSLTEDPEVVADAVRAWSGVSLADQTQWRRGGDYGPLNGWRSALGQHGIFVFSMEIGRDDVRGFSSWDAHAPLIAVNVSAVSPAARVFTLGHELGHLITRTDAACIEPSSLLVEVDIERWCEVFSAAFLMPADDVRRLARLRGLGLGRTQIDDVTAVMQHFGVSARAAALRLIGLNYAERSFYAEVEAVFRPKPAPPPDPNRPPKRSPRDVQREREYGPRALREVLNSLPEHVALRVLRITVDDARKLAERDPGIHASI